MENKDIIPPGLKCDQQAFIPQGQSKRNMNHRVQANDAVDQFSHNKECNKLEGWVYTKKKDPVNEYRIFLI